jgi:DNA-binding NarL/FixJ family response regulator
LDDGTVRARLLVADDHAFMRERIKAIVATTSDLEVVGET